MHLTFMEYINTMSFGDLVFYGIALLIIGSALAVVFLKNIVHSALCLVVSFLGVAAIYFMLSAGFLAVIQIMVYAGAISVLIIFAIMLVIDKDMKKTNQFSRNLGNFAFGIPIIGMVIVTMLVAICKSDFPLAAVPGSDQGVGQLAELMLGNFVVPFEAAAVLLLVAVIGAIIMAKGVDTK